MLTEDALFILVLLRWSREQVEGVEGGGRGTDTEKRDGGKRPRSPSVLILLVSLSCPRGYTGALSPKHSGAR